jgi:hypothetical protein
MHFEFTAEELLLIRKLITEGLHELTNEIRRTENFDLHDELKRQQSVLTALMQKLEASSSTTTR